MVDNDLVAEWFGIQATVWNKDKIFFIGMDYGMIMNITQWCIWTMEQINDLITRMQIY
jgi:hypothetical protein